MRYTFEGTGHEEYADMRHRGGRPSGTSHEALMRYLATLEKPPTGRSVRMLQLWQQARLARAAGTISR